MFDIYKQSNNKIKITGDLRFREVKQCNSHPDSAKHEKEKEDTVFLKAFAH